MVTWGNQLLYSLHNNRYGKNLTFVMQTPDCCSELPDTNVSKYNISNTFFT